MKMKTRDLTVFVRIYLKNLIYKLMDIIVNVISILQTYVVCLKRSVSTPSEHENSTSKRSIKIRLLFSFHLTDVCFLTKNL